MKENESPARATYSGLENELESEECARRVGKLIEVVLRQISTAHNMLQTLHIQSTIILKSRTTKVVNKTYGGLAGEKPPLGGHDTARRISRRSSADLIHEATPEHVEKSRKTFPKSAFAE